MKTDIKSMRKEALDRYFLSLGWEKYRSQQVFNWLHQKQVRSYDEMKNLPKALINQLEEATSLTCLKVVKVFKSSMDGTIKFLLALEDGPCD